MDKKKESQFIDIAIPADKELRKDGKIQATKRRNYTNVSNKDSSCHPSICRGCGSTKKLDL